MDVEGSTRLLDSSGDALDEPLTLKQKVRAVLGGWRRSRSSKKYYHASLFVEGVIVLCIVLLLVLSVLSTEDSLVNDDRFIALFYNFEKAAMVIFSVEYWLRLWSASDTIPGCMRWAVKPLSLIDLLSLVSLYVDVLSSHKGYKGAASTLRIFRGLRILLLFKMERQAKALKQLLLVFEEGKTELGICAVLTGVTVLLGSFVIYYFEGEAQPDKFGSIGASMYWAVVTVTTVGYGDMHPVSFGGKVTACIFSCIGVLVIALPSSLLSSSFVTVLKRSREVLRKESEIKTSPQDVDSTIVYLEKLAGNGNKEALQELLQIHEKSGKALRHLLVSHGSTLPSRVPQ